MKGIFYSALLLLLVFSCTFSPHGSHDVEVQPTPAVWVSYLDLLTARDTILLYQYTNLRYAINVQGHNSLRVSARLAAKEVMNSGSAAGSFEIRPFSLPDGLHTLTLTAVTNTGTGSLADKVGGEKLVFEKTWTVVVDNAPPQSPKIITLRDSNGRLRIEWEKYKRPNFSHYKVQVRIAADGYHPGPHNHSSNEQIHYYFPKDRNQTVVIDSGFVGGMVSASVSVTTLNHHTSFPSEALLDDARSRIGRFETLPGGKLKLTWNPTTKYYANFSGYALHPEYSYATPYYTSTNPHDTTFTTDQVGFGQSTKLLLFTQSSPQYSTCCQHILSTATNVYLGEKSTPYFFPLFTPADGLLYTADYGSISRWPAGQPEKSLQLTVNYDHDPLHSRVEPAVLVTPDGQRLLIGSGHAVREVNAADLSTRASYSTVDLLGAGTSTPTRLAAPEGNHLFFAMSRYVGYYNNYHYLVAYNTQTRTVSDTCRAPRSSEPFGQMTLNRKGNRLIYKRGTALFLLRFENGQFLGKQTPYALEGSGALFNPLNDEEIYAFGPGTVRLYDALNLQLKQQVSLEKTITGISIDPVTGNVGGSGTENYYYCFDPRTGRKLAVVKLKPVHNWSDQKVTYDLHNNFLYSSQGYKIKLDINP